MRYAAVFYGAFTLILAPPAMAQTSSKKTAPAPAKAATAKAASSASPAKPGSSVARPAPAPGPRAVPGPQLQSVAHPGPMNRPGPVGSHEVHSAEGTARMRPDGRPIDVHDARRNMDIHHDLAGGGRRIASLRPDGRRFVSERGRPGYIGHPYSFHGHEFERRTYYDHGRAYDRFYSPYRYHGYDMRVYAPGHYYPGALYGWAYRPWGAPVHYGWGWRSDPWYGYYHGYFTPYPVYASPSLWLTDYMFSQTLAAGYQASLESGAATGAGYSGPALSPETKQLVAAEVQSDIALENQEAQTNQQQGVPDPASSGIARLLGDGQRHAFVAGREVDVVDGSGQECALTDGDVIQVTGPLAPQDTTANATVLAGKGNKDCAAGSTVALGLDDLQEMQNHLRATVDQGLQQLVDNQGKSSLPVPPPSATAAPAVAVAAQGAPLPETDGAQGLAKQDAEAQQAEHDVLGSASPSAPPAPSNTNPF